MLHKRHLFNEAGTIIRLEYDIYWAFLKYYDLVPREVYTKNQREQSNDYYQNM